MEESKVESPKVEDKKEVRTRGTGSLIKKPNSRFYYAQVYEHGRKRTISLKTDKEWLAERKLRKLTSATERGEILPTDVARITYEELRDALIEDYKLSGRRSLYKGRLTSTIHLDEFFKNYTVLQITPDAIRKFTLARKAAGESPSTTNRSLAALKRMFHIAIRDRKLQHMPYIGMLKESPARKGFLEPDAFRKLRDALPDRLKTFTTMAYFTGMRCGELRHLRWDAIEMTGDLLRLYSDETKSGEPRLIPLNQETRAMLAMLPRDAGPYVFGGKVPLGSFKKSWKSACRRVGLSAIMFHDLRRSGVRNLRRAGVTESVAMKISGHKTRSVFERYNIVSEDDLRDAARKLDNFIGTATPTQSPARESADDVSTTEPKRLQ